MKIFGIIVIMFLQQSGSYATVLEYMSAKLGEFVDSIASTFKDITNNVKIFFSERLTDKHDQNIIDQKIRMAIKDFINRSAEESENRSSKYIAENYNFNDMKVSLAALMSTSQLAEFHGKKVESHVIDTQDGYLITLHRIIDPIASHNSDANGTILLHHGLLGSSADWILLGPNKSLPYILTRAGYDVWMINARGNYYSRGHMTKKVDTLEYWNFSFQEIGQFDLRASIDYIRKVKKNNHKINFIGHSMGATALLVLLSTVPEYNEYLKIGILLAPLVFMANIKGPLKTSISMASDPSMEILTKFGEGEFVPIRKISDWLAFKYCVGPKMYCSNPLLFLCGVPQEKDWNATFVATLLYHVPAGGSVKTILHYRQLATNGNFHKFGDASSEFDLSRVTLPLVMFSSSEDWLATVPDVLRLYFSLKRPIDHYVIRGKNISHTEFVWGSKAQSLIFSKVMEYLESNVKPVRTTARSHIDLQENEIFS